MTRGAIFWLIMILWLLFGILGWVEVSADVRVMHGIAYGHDVLAFILFALLGWHCYGPAVKG